MVWMLFAGLVRGHRRRLGLTQEELAGRAGLSVRAIRRIEAGRVGLPRAGTVRLLAAAFGLRDGDADRFCASGLGMAAGPPAGSGTGRVRPAELPADVAVFTGQQAQLRRLDRLLPEADGSGPGGGVIAAIGGPAGVGKTALAVHWAHRVRHRFRDGQLYVDLRGHSPGRPLPAVDALARFLRALGVPAAHTPGEPDEAAGLYRSLLADRHVLVLLDDAAGPEQVRPLLPGVGACCALVTSRAALGGLAAREGAHLLTLDPLTPAEAHALLARILGHQRVDTDPHAAAELARACGHLPQALHHAAAHLATRPESTIAAYLAHPPTGNRGNR
jgi:transcriptional regulator with XRE-family HTH domain